jgi:hypothetical protein
LSGGVERSGNGREDEIIILYKFEGINKKCH